MSNSQFTKAEDIKTDIEADIVLLNTIETDLTASLDNPQLPQTEKNKIYTKIDQVKNMKIELRALLSEINKYLQATLTNATNTLTNQTLTLNIIENEIKLSRQKMDLLKDDIYNKYRQVEINTYYSQKYSEHNKLILWIIAILAILTLVVFLNKKNIISNAVYFWLLLVTIICGIILITFKINNINKRNNMNYQEYDIYLDPQKYKTNTNSSSSNTPPAVDPWKTNEGPQTNCPNV